MDVLIVERDELALPTGQGEQAKNGGNPQPGAEFSSSELRLGERAMKWFVAGCAAVALTSGAAFAGPCSEQIAALQQSLSSRDAGAGPVQMKAGAGTSSQASEAGSSVRNTSEASRTAAELRATGQGSGSERVGPTAALGRATGGSAASAQDVRLQQQGQPTQAEAAQNGTPAASVGEDRLQKVAADLDRARSLDGKNDSECMGAISDARKDMATD